MAGLSKQHFIKIAEILNKNIYTQNNDGFKYLSLNEILEDLSSYFKTQNPLFNENRFKKACLK